MILKYQQFILNSTKHKQVLIKIKINKKIENSSATLTLLRWDNKLKSTFAMSSSCYSISKLLYRSIFFYTLFTSSPMSSNFTLTYQRNEKQQLVKFYTMHCSCIALNVFFLIQSIIVAVPREEYSFPSTTAIPQALCYWFSVIQIYFLIIAFSLRG